MIASGTRFGVYELVAPLGAGGMGEVYRARDSRLGRDVALKVLPPELASQPSSLARFEREARHVAALNHPNIVALFDVGTDNGVAYMVTELVDGTTLRGASLPLRKVAEIGAQIADALAAAHAAGVTHRDIKPDNVILAPSGRVKVLDFGVAKVTETQASHQLTASGTEVNAVVGTVGYMSPEQVRGDAVDSRADIFAVGVLLYELLAGAPAFRRETAVETMTATLRSDPPELPPAVPDGIRQIVRRCLEKNPEERFQSARDLAFALRQLTGSSVTAAVVESRRSRTPVWIGAAGFVFGLVAGAAALGWAAGRDTGVDPVQLTRITADRRTEPAAAFSPDGRSMAYVRTGAGLSELLVRPLDSLTSIVLVSSAVALRDPAWSVDGNQVCYGTAGREFWCVAAAGGAPRRVLQDATAPRIAPDGGVYFIRVFEKGPWLFHGTLTNGKQQTIGEPLPMDLGGLSQVSPDGSSLIVWGASGRWLVALPGGARRVLASEPGVRPNSIAWFSDSRHIVVAGGTTTPIGSRLVLEDSRGAARRLILQTPDPIDAVTMAADGARLVYSGGPVESDVVEYSTDGTFIRGIGTSSILEGFPEWAPRGDRFVYRVGGPGQVDSLWVGGAAETPATLVQRLSSTTAARSPVSPDGGRIAYVDADGIYVVAVPGGRPIRVFSSSRVSPGICWSVDGEWIWFSEGAVVLARVSSGGGEPVPLKVQPGPLADCSADGRWLLRRGPNGLLLTATDGTSERSVPRFRPPGGRRISDVRFGDGGASLFVIGPDGRTIDVLDAETGEKRRTMTFDLPPEDQIETFAVHPSGTRVLLTTGGERSDLWMVEGFPRPSKSWRRWFEHWESPPPAGAPATAR